MTLLEAPTIRQLAAVLSEDETERHWSSLVPLQPEGSLPPLYCMHAAGGNVLFYRDLARHLGRQQPLYGLQARGVDRTKTHHDRVEDMAADYLKEVRRLQPEGPYFLAGSSFGGLVAFEMACQLEREGVPVGFLGLFDTYGPGYPQPAQGSSKLRKKIVGCAERARGVRDSLRLLEPRERVAYVLGKTRKVKDKIVRKYNWRRNEIAIKFAAQTGRDLPKDMQRNQKAIDRARLTYEPQKYGGRLTLFRASRQPAPGLRAFR